MGDPNGLTIDRINNDLGYSKNNCKWVDRKSQSNNIRNNIKVAYKGQIKTIGEWADITGIPIDALRWRVHHK